MKLKRENWTWEGKDNILCYYISISLVASYLSFSRSAWHINCSYCMVCCYFYPADLGGRPDSSVKYACNSAVDPLPGGPNKHVWTLVWLSGWGFPLHFSTGMQSHEGVWLHFQQPSVCLQIIYNPRLFYSLSVTGWVFAHRTHACTEHLDLLAADRVSYSIILT